MFILFQILFVVPPLSQSLLVLDLFDYFLPRSPLWLVFLILTIMFCYPPLIPWQVLTGLFHDSTSSTLIHFAKVVLVFFATRMDANGHRDLPYHGMFSLIVFPWFHLRRQICECHQIYLVHVLQLMDLLVHCLWYC